MSIHQLVPVYATGDAVSAAARGIRDVLRDMGATSDIHADLIDPRSGGDALPADGLWPTIGADDTVIYHLSIGSPLAQRVASFPGRRVVVFHNITPARFFRVVNPRVARRIAAGERDLKLLAPLADLCICCSAFNMDGAVAAGSRSSVVIPPHIDLSRLNPQPAIAPADPHLLFVGRFAPNKRQEEVIRVLAALRGTTHPRATLSLVGSADDTAVYLDALRAFATRLGVSDAVDFVTGRVSDDEVARRYRTSSVFVCASEHEGFGMPLVEAMAFHLPVVAFAAGAVPETVGDAGVVLQHRDPLVWAAVIGRVLDDKSLRGGLIQRGTRRCADLTSNTIATRLKEALRGAGITS